MVGFEGRKQAVFSRILQFGLLFPFFAPFAAADGEQPQGAGKDEGADDTSEPDPIFGSRVSILGNIDVGAVITAPNSLKNENDKSGYFVNASGLAAIYTEKVTIDLGIGALTSKVRGEPKSVVDPSVLPDRERITFTAGTLQTAVRWSVNSRFEVGPVLIGTFGADASFSPDPKAEAATRLFGGLQFVKNWTDYRSYDARLGFTTMLDFNISERTIVMFGLGGALGIPLVKPSKIVRTKVLTKTKTKTVEKVVYQPVYVFQTDNINFENDKSILLPDSQLFLQDLGRILSAELSWWETMEIAGHTDSVGTVEYNMKLSQDRADAVRNALVEVGVPADRLTAKGYGPTVPIVQGEDPVALAKNRRVEMMFSGEVDQTNLGPELDRLRKKYERPATCRGKKDCR